MKHIWHDLVHAFTHADQGFLYTIRELAVRPGVVAREYMSGKRKKYFNPFSLLVIILGIYIIANSVFKPYTQDVFTTSKPPAWVKTESQKKKYEYIHARRMKMGEFINKHTNVVLFVSTPFIAFIFWLFFRRRYNYAEHLATMAYANGFISILTILLFGPLLYYVRDQGIKQFVYVSMMATHVLYMSFMYYGFICYSSAGGYFKALGAAVAAIIAWALFSGTLGLLYVFSGI